MVWREEDSPLFLQTGVIEINKELGEKKKIQQGGDRFGWVGWIKLYYWQICAENLHNFGMLSCKILSGYFAKFLNKRYFLTRNL